MILGGCSVHFSPLTVWSSGVCVCGEGGGESGGRGEDEFSRDPLPFFFCFFLQEAIVSNSGSLCV